MSLIINNTVLSNFASVNGLCLLKSIFHKVYLTPQVYHEVKKGIRDGYIFQKHTKTIIENQEWLILTELSQKELDIYYKHLQKLGSGESSCLAIAESNGYYSPIFDLSLLL